MKKNCIVIYLEFFFLWSGYWVETHRWMSTKPDSSRHRWLSRHHRQGTGIHRTWLPTPRTRRRVTVFRHHWSWCRHPSECLSSSSHGDRPGMFWHDVGYDHLHLTPLQTRPTSRRRFQPLRHWWNDVRNRRRPWSRWAFGCRHRRMSQCSWSSKRKRPWTRWSTSLSICRLEGKGQRWFCHLGDICLTFDLNVVAKLTLIGVVKNCVSTSWK